MEIRLGVRGDGTAALLDLHRWLRGDQDVSRHARIGLGAAEPSDEDMGAVEVISLVVGHTLTALNLALSYAAWRQARPAAPAVTLTVGERTLVLHDASDETVQRIVRELTGEAAREADGGTGTA